MAAESDSIRRLRARVATALSGSLMDTEREPLAVDVWLQHGEDGLEEQAFDDLHRCADALERIADALEQRK